MPQVFEDCLHDYSLCCCQSTTDRLSWWRNNGLGVPPNPGHRVCTRLQGMRVRSCRRFVACGTFLDVLWCGCFKVLDAFWYEFEGCIVSLRFVSWYGLRGGVGYEGKFLEAVLVTL